MDSEQKHSSVPDVDIKSSSNPRDNTEYLPTRCRITKPAPPKPAANPMQFVKVGPCGLYRKAQEQLKKVEEVKTVRQEIRDDAEDWQANLDNWKSSRRKRQEHIIERVVEVKKLEQQEIEKSRRKGKTFNEMLEERNRRRCKVNISIFDDDPNDFSDYGLGHSKRDDSDNVTTDEDSQSVSDCSAVRQKNEQNSPWQPGPEPEPAAPEPPKPQYTYESAIEGYRTRVIASNLKQSGVAAAPAANDAASPDLPKVNIRKRKELFENLKTGQESVGANKLPGDFVHSQSLKERLMSLKKYSEQTHRTDELSDAKNNNVDESNEPVLDNLSVRRRVSMIDNLSTPTILDFNVSEQSTVIYDWSKKECALLDTNNPQAATYVNKLNSLHQSLDNLTDSNQTVAHMDRVFSLDGLEYCHNTNYPASNSSTELLILSSQCGDTDREDSGIHTTDVSCSVSQAGEPAEDSDVPSTTFTDKPLVADGQQTIPKPETNLPANPTLSTENVEYLNNQVYPFKLEIVFSNEEFPFGPPATPLEPPKEKPPPPPLDSAENDELSEDSKLKRLNSTKRIKNEMRMKRSSFLGIDSEDPAEVEAAIRKPPDLSSFLQRESRLEKQLYKKTQGSYSEAGDSQDSGVELERGRLSSDTWCSSLPDSVQTPVHGRQDSEPCTTNSITSEEDEITKKEREIIEMVEKEEKWKDKETDYNTFNFDNVEQSNSHNKIKLDVVKDKQFVPKKPIRDKVPEYMNVEDDEHSEVLRVEHELLQLEREEMERQHENMIFRESRARLKSKGYLKSKPLSLEDITAPLNQPVYMYQSDSVDYRKSMPELQHEVQLSNFSARSHSSAILSRSSQNYKQRPLSLARDQPKRDKVVRKTSTDSIESEKVFPIINKAPRPPMRHSVQLLSAAPKPQYIPQDEWLQNKPEPRDTYNYNQHWLIQEAEQRRITEQQKYTVPAQNWKHTRPEKHLPDSVIQTLTQRVQSKVNLSDRDRNLLSRRMENVPGHYAPQTPHSVGHALPILHPQLMADESQDKMLSVSGKKKCSYCGIELGRGAAMIIESLSLFYHMECFKCCVCHMQLGDGLMGTDVRVRNNKLHCHNCYSSDDGVKFSCV